MKRMILKQSLAVLALASFMMMSATCKNKNKSANLMDAKIEEVKNMTGVVHKTDMDGCTYLIHVKKDVKLLVAKMSDANFIFYDGQKLKFDYRTMNNVASVCMVEDKIIEITKCEDLNPKKPSADCKVETNIKAVEWMNRRLSTSKANRVVLYEYDGKPAYLFEITECCDQISTMYDCNGNRICDSGGITGGDCLKLRDTLKRKRVLWPEL